MLNNSFVNIIIEVVIIGLILLLVQYVHYQHLVGYVSSEELTIDNYLMLESFHFPIFWNALFLTAYFRFFLFKGKNAWINLLNFITIIPACYYCVQFLKMQITLNGSIMNFIDSHSKLGIKIGEIFKKDSLPTKYLISIFFAYALLCIPYFVKMLQKKDRPNGTA